MNKCIDFKNCNHQKCKSCQRMAFFRVCAHCEHVYIKTKEKNGCPKCEFASYGAYFVYGSWIEVLGRFFFNKSFYGFLNKFKKEKNEVLEEDPYDFEDNYY